MTSKENNKLELEIFYDEGLISPKEIKKVILMLRGTIGIVEK